MEQKTKHTPGPWILTKEKHGIIEEFVIAGLSYGNANDQNYLILAENGDDSQQYSNALLVRAAPEMLEALKEAKTYINCHVTQTIPRGGVLTGNDMLKLLNNIIAKAEGGSHA